VTINAKIQLDRYPRYFSKVRFVLLGAKVENDMSLSRGST